MRGIDAVDGTPVLDIKPYFAQFGPRGDVRQPAWSDELMAEYWTGPAGPAPRLSTEQSTDWMAEVARSPKDHGSLTHLVARPETDERDVLTEGVLDPVVGLVGDNWLARGSRNAADGKAEPDAQLNLMNSRCALLVAGTNDRVPLAGDQLYVDLDLSPENLPPGTRLTIGEAVIEVTAKPHTGCAKFTKRFGLAAHRWINAPAAHAMNLRGICARVVVGGTVRPGDTITVSRPPS